MGQKRPIATPLPTESSRIPFVGHIGVCLSCSTVPADREMLLSTALQSEQGLQGAAGGTEV